MSVTVGTIETKQQALLDGYIEQLPQGSIKARIEPYLNLDTMRNPKQFSFIEDTAQTYKAWLPKNTSEVLTEFKELENRRQNLPQAGTDAGIASQQPPSATIAPSLLDRAAAAAESAAMTASDKLNEIGQRVNTWWKEKSTLPDPEKPYGSTVTVGEKSNLRGEHFSANANPSATENPDPQGPPRSYIGYHFGGLDPMNTGDSKPSDTPVPSVEAALVKYGVLSP